MNIRRTRLLTLLGVLATSPAFAQDAPAKNPFDQDGDLIGDGVDKCPSEPEDYNGYKDGDGCPDQRIADLLQVPDPKVETDPQPLLHPQPKPQPLIDSLLKPAPAAPTPLPTPKPVGDTFTCEGEVRGFDSLLGARFRCDGDPTSWHMTAGVDMQLPRVIRTGARGKAVMKRHGPDGVRLVSFETGGNVYKPEPKPDDGCFLTTAAARYRGLPDDCAELQAMRSFRDTYLGSDHPDVRDYYATAPSLVEAIEARNDAATVWAVVFEDYLTPILEMLASGAHDDAHAAYRQLVRDLQNTSTT